MFGQTIKSRMLCVSSILCLTASLFGCGKKDLSPPPVNQVPHDVIVIALNLIGKQDAPLYRIKGQIEYGNLSRSCSEIHYFDGGWVEYPHGYVTVDVENNSLKVYRDYYKPRRDCTWRLLGLSIQINDEEGRLAIGGLPANSLKAGYGEKLHCNFSNKSSGNCLPGEAGRVRTDLTVDISIH